MYYYSTAAGHRPLPPSFQGRDRGHSSSSCPHEQPSKRTPVGEEMVFFEWGLGSRKKIVRRETRKSIEGMGKRSLVSRLCSLEILHHHLSVQSGSSLSLSESSHSLPLLPSPTTFNGPSVNESRASATHRVGWGGSAPLGVGGGGVTKRWLEGGREGPG